MGGVTQVPLLLIGIFVVVAGAAAAILLPRRNDRRRRLRDLATLLRVSDPNIRIQALERAHALKPRDRASLSGALRSQLSSAAKGAGPHPSGQLMTVWFIRQILALLGDSKANVRMDAARALRAVMRKDGDRPAEHDDATPPAPAVAAAIEIAGGRAFAGGESTRMLAFAEMLEAGLRPLAVGIQNLESVTEEAMEPLTAALRDRSPRVRRSLCEVLAAMGGDKSEALLGALLQDPSPELRARAAQALGGLKSISAVAQLTPLLQDPMAEVRSAAASALAEIGVEIAYAKIVEALGDECRRDDGTEAARAAMIEAIAKLSDGVKAELADALTNLPRPTAARLAVSLEKSGALERWLSDPVRDKGDLLARVLGIVVKLGVTRPFLEALDSTQEWVRLRAAAALGHSHDPAALNAVAALLNDPDASVRARAVASLAAPGQPLALSPLARAAADPDVAVRMSAISGLRQVLQQRSTWRTELLPGAFDMGAAMADAQRALLHAAADAQELVRTEAAGALGTFTASETAEALVNLALADESQSVRETATGALAQAPIPHVGRLLAAALEDAGEQRRARAVAVLAVSGGPGTGRFIIEALHDPSASVRAAALAALARSQASAPAESLIAELRNPDARIRATVAARLGRERSPECVEALAHALGDPEEEVRVNAINALGNTGRLARRHEGAMTARITDPSPRVREAAAAALRTLREAWAEGPEAMQIFRQGPLSPEAAANLVEAAVGGDMSPFLRAIEEAAAAQSLVAYLAGAGRGRLNPLLLALRHADERDQAKALPALSQALRKAGNAGEYLAELKALDSGARLMAVEVAGLLGTPEATTGLLEALARDPLPEVRSRAASVLASAPGDEVRAALARAQEDDPNEVVRLVAARSLSRARGGGESVPVLPTTEETPNLDSVQGGAR